MYNLILLTSAHGGGILTNLIEWMLRGFAWRIGGRVASALPQKLVILIFVLGIVYLIYRWYKNRHNQ